MGKAQRDEKGRERQFVQYTVLRCVGDSQYHHTASLTDTFRGVGEESGWRRGGGWGICEGGRGWGGWEGGWAAEGGGVVE